MELAIFSYAVVMFLLAALVYIFCISTRLDVDRRFSVGRLSIQRILAENGRRLSQFGQRIEQFSQVRETSDTTCDLRRRSACDNLSQVLKYKPEVHPAVKVDKSTRVPANRNIPRIVETPPENELATVKEVLNEDDHHPSDEQQPKPRDLCANDTSKGTSGVGIKPKPQVPATMRKVCIKETSSLQGEKHLDIYSTPSASTVKHDENTVRQVPRERRDSLMPTICDPKCLPRRKSFLPVLTEESTYVRRLSTLPTTVGDTLMSATTRHGSVLVKPPAYVCPRKSSVLFNSDIFARSPVRKMSFSMSAMKPVTAPPTDNDRKSGNSSESRELDTGRPRKTARRASRVAFPPLLPPPMSSPAFYPCRRRSSLAQRHARPTTPVKTMTKVLTDMLPDLQKALSSGGSRVKDALKIALQKNEISLPYLSKEANNEDTKPLISTKNNYITGNLSEYKDAFGPDAHEVLSRKRVSHGPVYEISALGQRTVFLFDHRDIELLKKAEGRYPKHMDFKHLRLYRKRNNLPLGLLLSHGEEWKQQRNVLSKLLLGTTTSMRYASVIQQVAKEAVALIGARRPVNTGAIFDPEQDVSNYSIEAFGRILYGRNLKCLDDHKRTDLHHFVDIAKKNFEDAKALLTLPSCLMLLHPAWRRHNERWNFLLETTIKQVRLSLLAQQTSPSVLNQLIKGGKMTEPEMLINLTDMLLASIDTTTNAILWCLYELARHPEIQLKIMDEFRCHSNESGDITFEGLQQMTYTKAVIKETLRLHPVGFLACRTILKGMTVKQHTVPAKSNVANCMYVMGRSDTLGTDMGVFRPARWLKKDSNLDQFYHEVPFGFGPRMCIGRRVAEMEIAMFTIEFCRSFDFTLNPACHIDHLVKLLLVPSRPLELVLNTRARDNA